MDKLYTLKKLICFDVKVHQMSSTTCYCNTNVYCTSSCLYAHVHVYNMSVYLSIYTSISLSVTSHLILFLLGLAKLMDICAPTALINATSFFLTWAYPELAINPPNGEVANIAEVQITYKTEATKEDMVTEQFPSLNVTISGLLSDMIYTVIVHVVFSQPCLYGEDVILSIQTLPEGLSFICNYVCMYLCMYVCLGVFVTNSRNRSFQPYPVGKVKGVHRLFQTVTL